MQIIVNGKPQQTAVETLAELLEALDMTKVRVATALNGDFVGATKRADTKLAEGDTVEIVAPRQGG